MDIYLVRTDAGLRAYTDEDYDKLHRFKVGETVKASVVKPRNLAFHRKFFAMLRCGWDCLTEQQRENMRSQDGYRQYVLIVAGFTDIIYDMHGNKFSEKAKSISFAKMDDTEFEKVYNRTLDVILAMLASNNISEDTFNDILRNYG